jgi:hypothetical protein
MSLKNEIKKFRTWAKKYPLYKRNGEWECDYHKWGDIRSAFDEWLAKTEHLSDSKEIDDVLYIIARDNECEALIKKLAKNQNLSLQLAKSSVNTLHTDAKWQLAKVIATFDLDEIDALLFNLSIDRSDYAQRICMMESAKRKSKYTKEMIEWSWFAHEEHQKISALWSLYWINDPDLAHYLKKAKESNLQYLMRNAEEIEAKINNVE